MDNQMLKHLLLSFFSKLTCFKIIGNESMAINSSKMDETCFENIKEWIPKKPPSIRKKKKKKNKKRKNRKKILSNKTPKIFTTSFPLDLSMSFTRYLNSKDRSNLSYVNSNFYHFTSQKMAFYDWDFSINRSKKKILEKLKSNCKVAQNIESLTIYGAQYPSYYDVPPILKLLGSQLTNIRHLDLSGEAVNGLRIESPGALPRELISLESSFPNSSKKLQALVIKLRFYM